MSNVTPLKRPFSLSGGRVWVAGHRGMVGSAIVRRLQDEKCELLLCDRATVDLRDQREVFGWMDAERPDVVVLAAAKVGGILANDRFPADFIYENLVIETNVIEAARRAGVRKLVFLGSSCIYPRSAPQPMAEGSLLTGPLEATNQWYAVAKIAGVKLCQAYRRQHGCDFISVMPTNLYGPNDNFDLETSHVLPALLRKFHEAKVSGAESVTVWGSGRPRRELMHVDDCADAVVHLLKHYSGEEIINIGTGEDIEIKDLASLIRQIVGYRGAIEFDSSKPDGTPRKLLEVSRLEGLGWRARIDLSDGIRATYDWYLEHVKELRTGT